ncbi:MAG: hypothetical protein Q8940_07190 [Bacteroidota bacterium]|nr:hypothetical protein [Bacteroidota bacterium]
MAGEINKELSRQLAIKLQDPVSSGEQDTTRISALQRLDYLKRGMYRFIRVLWNSYPKLTRTVLSKYITYKVVTSNKSGQIGIEGIVELYSLYLKRLNEETYVKARIIDPFDFLDVMTGQNNLYVPDLEARKFFACEIDGQIELLPAVEYGVMLYYMKTIPYPTFEANDIELKEQFWDILMDYAASEHYLDIGQLDFVQSFKADAAEQLQLLLLRKQEQEKHDEKN